MGQVRSMQHGALEARRAKAVFHYVLAALLSLALVVLVLRLWRADLALPFIHKSDARFTSMCIKGIIENGWYLTNPRLAAPHGMNLADYPMSDNLHFLGFKLLSYLSDNWAVVQNLYFLLTFPLTTLSALFVFRRFHCHYISSLVGSLLFTFLPYHFMRGEIHLFLASYYLVPVMIMVILEVFLDLPIFSLRMRCVRWAPWITLAARVFICLLVASAGVYYTFFACFLLLVAGCSGCYYSRTLRPVARASGFIILLGVATGANLYPTLVYRLEQGPNPQSAIRDPFHADVFGLKPVQLLLPVTDHRLAFVRRLKTKYNDAFRPLVNENDHASLGIVGGLGFLAMLGRFVYRRDRVLHTSLNDALAILCVASLFLCTIGGVGSLFALFISPMIRGYNRISVYIAFFSLFTVVLHLERLWAGRSSTVRRSLVALMLPYALLVFGIWDQTSDKFIPPYTWVRDELTSDRRFIRAIESRLPANALVFQLPYASFPEHGLVHHMVEYDHFRGYLHSEHLRWSYGNMKGRAGDAWAREISSEPPEDMVRHVAQAGFSGIYIDRTGFAYSATELETTLIDILGVRPIVSSDNVLVFFDLSDYRPKAGGGDPTTAR